MCSNRQLRKPCILEMNSSFEKGHMSVLYYTSGLPNRFKDGVVTPDENDFVGNWCRVKWTGAISQMDESKVGTRIKSVH